MQHNKWSEKNCPRHLWGIDWNGFLKLVRSKGDVAIKPPTPPKYETTNTNFKVGQKVRIKKSAKTYTTGQTIPASIKCKTDTIM